MEGKTGDAFVDMCSGWKSAPVPSYWAEPVVSDKPVLLLSGELDPVTPPAWGDLAAETLPNSKHLTAPNASHTIASHTCANKLIAEFIEKADVTAIDGSCLQKQRLKALCAKPKRSGAVG